MREYEKKYGNRTYKMQDFESMSEIANYLEDVDNLKSYSLAKSTLLSQNPEFYGTRTFEGLLDRLKFGDQQITTMYLDKLKQLKSEGEQLTTIKMDIEGFAYDMGAVVSGEPECCLNSGYPETKPHLNIYIDVGYCGGVSPETIANRGVAILQLISNLISQGYLLDIWIVHYITASDDNYYCQRVKLSTEFLTISQLAFAGKCEFFRVVAWLLTAIQMKYVGYTGSGCSQPSDSVIKELKADGLYIPSGYTDSRFNNCSLNKAIDIVTKIYNDYVNERVKCGIRG